MEQDDERRKRVRRTALILALVAIALYAGFIAMSMIDASRATHNRGAQPSPASAPH